MTRLYLGKATMASLLCIATLVAITFFGMYFPLLLYIFLVVEDGHSKFPPVHFIVSGNVAFPQLINSRTTAKMAVNVNAGAKCPLMYIVLLMATKLRNF